MQSSYFRRKAVNEKRSKLENLFKAYADNRGCLGQDQLRKAFEHLGATMPYKQAEEALTVVGYNITKESTEKLNKLVEYAINCGFGDSV
ncbi:hypothetical protein PTKIN_Ptkin13bG0100000 [Pterospermum kingtungense]